MKAGKLLEILTRYKLSADVLVMVDGVPCEVLDTKRVKSDNVRLPNQTDLVLIPALPELL